MNSKNADIFPAATRGSLRFPVRDQIKSRESGQGYALRMTAENGLFSLYQVKRWLGKSASAVIDSHDAALLSQFYGADLAMLEFALGNVAISKKSQNFTFAANRISRSYFVNRAYPRVCPACVKENGICELIWDLALNVSCARHGALLTDRCAYCGDSLSWNRPAVRVCRCGNWITNPANADVTTEVETQMSTWIDSRIKPFGCGGRADEAKPDEMSPMMKMIWPLSLDSGFCVVYALGTAATFDASEPRNCTRPRESLKKARQILARAAKFSEKICRGEHIKLRVIRPNAVLSLLADSAASQVNAEDKNLAYSLIRAFLNPSKSKTSGNYPQLAQMEMFSN